MPAPTWPDFVETGLWEIVLFPLQGVGMSCLSRPDLWGGAGDIYKIIFFSRSRSLVTGNQKAAKCGQMGQNI